MLGKHPGSTCQAQGNTANCTGLGLSAQIVVMVGSDPLGGWASARWRGQLAAILTQRNASVLLVVAATVLICRDALSLNSVA